MKYITDNFELYLRVEKMIPKRLLNMGYTVDDIIEDCEYSDIDGGDGYDPCYWVYLRDGFITENGNGSHTIHEDTLKEIKYMLSTVVRVDEDAKQ